MGQNLWRSVPGSCAALLAMVLVACSPGTSAPPPPALYVLADRDVESLDPHVGGALFQTQSLLANAYEGLVAFDADLKLVPALALSWTNPTDRTCEFELRPGVRFHDGRPLEAADVVWSLERARTHERSVLKGALGLVASLEALTPSRVRITTREPDAALLSRLTDAFISARPQGATQPDFERASCGSGPYRIVARRAGETIDLERFTGYWGDAPAFQRARLVARRYGDADLGQFVPHGSALAFWTPPGQRFYEQAQREARVYAVDDLYVASLTFDLHGPTSPGVRLRDGRSGNPFQDRRVRRAFALAIDYAALVREAAGGQARVASQPVASSVFGFDAAVAAPVPDLQRARRLLAEAGFPKGFTVELDLRLLGANYGPALQRSLAAAGIDVQANVLDEEAFIPKVRDGRSSLHVRRFACRGADAQEFLDRWAHSRDSAHGYGEVNTSYERSPVPGLDAQIELARREMRPAVRLARLQAALRRVSDEVLLVPLLAEKKVLFVSPGVVWSRPNDPLRRLRFFSPS